MRNNVDCPDITIANGASVSGAVRLDMVHEDADDIMLLCSTIDGARTYKIQINDKKDGTGSWYDLYDGAANVVPPSAVNRATIYPFLSYTFRIVADAAVIGPITWKMKKAYSIH